MATYNFNETRPIGRPSGTMRILAVTVDGLAALEAALVGSGITLVVDRVVPNGTTLVSITGGTGTCTIPWDFLGNAEEYQVQIDSVDVLDCSTFGTLYRDVYAISDTVFPNVTSIATTGSGQYAPIVGGGVEFISGYGNIAPADPVATGDWALRYTANEMPALGDVSIVGDITGEFAFAYVTDEVEVTPPTPPSCSLNGGSLVATIGATNRTTTYINDGVNVRPSGFDGGEFVFGYTASPLTYDIYLLSDDSTVFSTPIVADGLVGVTSSSPVLIPTEGTIDLQSLVDQALAQGATSVGINIYDATTGPSYYAGAGLLVPLDGAGDPFLPRSRFLELVDGIGLFVVTDSTAALEYTLEVTFAEGQGLDYCGVVAPPPPRKRSSTLNLAHARFYMSYKYIPAGSNTLPPQVSEVTLLGG